MENKLTLIVDDNFNPETTKLLAVVDLSKVEIVKRSEICEIVSDEVFEKRMREVCQKNFGYFGSDNEKKINEIIEIAKSLKLSTNPPQKTGV